MRGKCFDIADIFVCVMSRGASHKRAKWTRSDILVAMHVKQTENEFSLSLSSTMSQIIRIKTCEMTKMWPRGVWGA